MSEKRGANEVRFKKGDWFEVKLHYERLKVGEVEYGV